MTLLAKVFWECQCGHKNDDQLYVMTQELHGEEYQNGDVPAECGLNWTDRCAGCGKFELSEQETSTREGFIRFEVNRALTGLHDKNDKPIRYGDWVSLDGNITADDSVIPPENNSV